MPSEFLLGCPSCEGGSGSFYGLNVRETDGTPAYEDILTLTFNSDTFYITQGTDASEATVNLRFDDPGEVNTASNIGSGAGVFDQKVGVDLQFKSLVAGANITLSPSATEVTIAATNDGGFYGIVVKEDDTVVAIADSLQFEADDFNVSAQDGDARIVISENIARLSDLSPGFYGITVKEDGTVIAVTDSLQFEADDFNVSVQDGDARIVISENIARLSDLSPGFYGVVFEESDGSNSQKDDTLRFLAGDFDLSSVGDKPQVALAVNVARLSDIGPGFYGITVGSTDDNPSYKGVNTLKFFSNDFYLERSLVNTDNVHVNLRHRLTQINDSGNQINVLKSVVPATNATLNLGGPLNRFDKVFAKQIIAVENSNHPVATYNGGSVFGTSSGPAGTFSQIQASSPNTIRGSFANGYTLVAPGAADSGAIARIRSAGHGSFATGSVYTYAPGARGYLNASARSTMAFGTVYALDGTSTVEATAVGSAVFGRANNNSAGTVSRLRASGSGALAIGYNAVTTSSAYMTASGVGSFATGRNQGTIQATGIGSFARGSTTRTTGGAATIEATGLGTAAMGQVQSASGAGGATMTASGPGSFTSGSVRAASSGSAVMVAGAAALAYGSHALGYIRTAGTGNVSMNSGGHGSLTHGHATGTGGGSAAVNATGTGSTAGGYARGAGSATAGIVTSGGGAFGHGNAQSTGAGSSYIRATGSGAFAMGFSVASTTASAITSGGGGSFAGGASENGRTLSVAAGSSGSMAFGHANTANITVSNSAAGSLAFGAATTGNIAVTASNAFQFGPGTNATTGQLQVMNSIQLNGSTGGITMSGPLDHDGETLGFFYHVPVSRRMDFFYLVVPGTPTTDSALVAVSGTGDDSDINNNFAELAAKVNRIRDILRDYGLIGAKKL